MKKLNIIMVIPVFLIIVLCSCEANKPGKSNISQISSEGILTPESEALVSQPDISAEDISSMSEDNSINEISKDNNDVLPESLSLSHDQIEIAVTCQFSLLPIIEPYNAENKMIEWSTDNPSALSVNNGTITGIAVGTARITAKMKADRDVYATCDVTVVENKAVVFSDEKFEQAVRENLVKPEGVLMLSDTMRLTGFEDYLNFAAPENLEDLKYCPNITYLILNLRAVDDLTPLSYCKKINYLVIDGCMTSDISVLSQLKNIETLMLYNMEIKNTLPIAALTKLESLRIINTNISDIEFMANLKNLNGASLSNNNIKDIKPLSDLIQLDWISLVENDITDITPLSDIINLTEIDISGNKIKDISALKNCTSLQTILMDNNEISDLSPLEKLSNINTIHAAGNHIKDISALADKTINNLYLNNNSIADISPLSTITFLQYLNLGSNNITDITPLSSLNEIYQLILDENPISDLSPLENKKTIHSLYIWNIDADSEEISELKQSLSNCEIVSDEKYVEVIDNP